MTQQLAPWSVTGNASPKKRGFPSWGLKVAMAITGLIWGAFVLVHLFGNLKVFVGWEDFNGYAHWLRHALYPLLPSGFLLWAFRIVLASALVIHVYAATVLYIRGRRGGTVRSWRNLQARLGKGGRLQALSAALMPVTGLIILAFVIFHILDLTIGLPPLAGAGFEAATGETSFAYQNLVASFQRPWIAAFYVITMVLLSLHVFHGVRTAATDLGAMGYRLRAVATWVAGFAAIAILLGNGLIPLAVQFGVLT